MKFYDPKTEFTEGTELFLNGETFVGDSSSGATTGVDRWKILEGVVSVKNVSERNAYYTNWRSRNPVPVSPPGVLPGLCIVLREDGAVGGLLEVSANGSIWYALSPAPGDMEMTLLDTAPSGWILAQGQTIPMSSQSPYQYLFDAVPATWKSGNNLKIPDLRGRVPVGSGQGSNLTNRNLGDKGGSEGTTLQKNHLPAEPYIDPRITGRGYYIRGNAPTGAGSGNVRYLVRPNHMYSNSAGGVTGPVEVGPATWIPSRPWMAGGAGGAPAPGGPQPPSTGAAVQPPVATMTPFVTVNYKIKL